MFDTANGQKNRFRLQREGVPDALLYRKTFPFLPWGHIENPRTLKRKVNGVEKELFTDGWMRVTGCRKIAYTGDNMQALCWGLACGVGTGAPLYFMPFFYWFFHFCMLIHRGFRDEHECKIRYGNMWDEYCEIVPYRYIPYVF
jgi:delta24(24(1))-sterol reductase